MNREILGLVGLLCLALAWDLACERAEDGSSTDAGQARDDDNDDNNDASPADDDDNDDNDDDSTPYTCEALVPVLEQVCRYSYLEIGPSPDLAAWCPVSTTLFAGAMSPFWLCLGDCAYIEDCSEVCFDGCEHPADPGGNGCDHTVHGIYACGVVFIYEENGEFLIPEMDIQAACSGSMSDQPWDCYGDCTGSMTCSDPPTQQEAQAMIECLNACR